MLGCALGLAAVVDVAVGGALVETSGECEAVGVEPPHAASVSKQPRTTPRTRTRQH